MIDILSSSSGERNNMDFSFVTRMPIPLNPNKSNRREAIESLGGPLHAFSADGYKFAIATADGVVSVWDLRSKAPLNLFMADASRHDDWSIFILQFHSGISGKEVLVFVEVS